MLLGNFWTPHSQPARQASAHMAHIIIVISIDDDMDLQIQVSRQSQILVYKSGLFNLLGMESEDDGKSAFLSTSYSCVIKHSPLIHSLIHSLLIATSLSFNLPVLVLMSGFMQ